MKYRKLRIAWSVVWGVLALLVFMLLVRSYSMWDGGAIKLHGDDGVLIRSLRGQLTFEEVYELVGFQGSWYWARYHVRQESDGGIVGTNDAGIPWTYLDRNNLTVGVGVTRHKVFMPHWFPTVIFLTLAVSPWFSWRFSLRTLLIGMTVAAIGLGWIVYAVRQ